MEEPDAPVARDDFKGTFSMEAHKMFYAKKLLCGMETYYPRVNTVSLGEMDGLGLSDIGLWLTEPARVPMAPP